MAGDENLYILSAALEMFSTISERRRPEKRIARKTSSRNMSKPPEESAWESKKEKLRSITFLLHRGEETKAFMESSSENLKMSFSVESMYKYQMSMYKYQMQDYNC